MRKDVKFGLTVGAILLVTLIVYALVLSRSGQAIKSEEAANAPANVDATPAPSDDQSTAAPSTPAVPASPDSVSPPDIISPATQPSAQANRPFDWNDALSNGGSVPANAPERTVTPTLDPISPDVHPVTIDNLPSTQPSLPPSLSAPAPDQIIAPPQQPIAPAQAPSPASSTPRSHVVAEGESLWTIAEAVYGNGADYTRIVAANPNINPKDLKVGQTLTIPALTGDQTPSAAAPTVSTPRIDSNAQYQVQSGDSLDKIAQKLYGDPTMANKIYDANLTLIGQDEDRLKVGWILKLPAPPTERQ
jgi:LysM repeat protein